MKKTNKLILLLLMLAIGVVPVMAAEPTVENLDFLNLKVIADGCIECGATNFTVTNLIEEKVSKDDMIIFQDYANSNMEEVKCDGKYCPDENEDCRFRVTGINNIKAQWPIAIREVSEVSSTIIVGTEGEEGTHYAHISNVKDNYALEILNAYYTRAFIQENFYWINNKFFSEQNKDNHRLFYDMYGDELVLISFNKGEVDIYTDEDTGEKVGDGFANKIKISSIYNDRLEPYKTALEPNNRNDVTAKGLGALLLVCENHRKCGECGKNVATSGEFCVQGENILSGYCPTHACGFIWDVKNYTHGGRVSSSQHEGGSSENNFEGLACKDSNEGHDFCPEHKCDSCDNPVIGRNQNDAFGDVSVYCGSLDSNYSNYCVNHFCVYIGCGNPRQSLTNTGKADDFSNLFCKEHNNGLCAIEGCTNKVSATFMGSPICKEHLMARITLVDIKKMSFLKIEGTGEGANLFIGGNNEMRKEELELALAKFGLAISGVSGDIIIAASNETSDAKRQGNNWTGGKNISITAEQMEQANVSCVQAYSSGSQLAIAATSELLSQGNEQVERVVLYDGFFGVDTLPAEFENILQSGTEVTFYWTDSAVQYYGTAAGNLSKWEKEYPNLKLIKLDDANHSTVIDKACEKNGIGGKDNLTYNPAKEDEKDVKPGNVTGKCINCDATVEYAIIVKGYCVECISKINDKKEEIKENIKVCDCGNTFISNYDECNRCIENAQKDKDNKMCEHQYKNSGYIKNNEYYHFEVKTCTKCSEEKLITKEHEYDANKKCKLCDEEKCKKSQMHFKSGSAEAKIMLLAGKSEMEDSEATRAVYKTVIGNDEGDYVIVTTTEKSAGEGNSKNWVSGNNKEIAGDYIVNSDINAVHAYSNSSHIAIEAVYNAKDQGAQVQELVMYDGFYGFTNDNSGHFESIVQSGTTNVEFYYTNAGIKPYSTKRIKNLPEGYKEWLKENGYPQPSKNSACYYTNPEHYLMWLAEENPNFTLVKLGNDANHANVVDKAQEYRE